MGANKLVSEIISVIDEVKPVPLHLRAYEKFIDNLERELHLPSLSPPCSPPEFFKCCTILNQDNSNKELELLFPNWPTCITADECATNTAAVNKLTEQIGLVSPGDRCSSHAAHGSMKRLASSKTMCVEEVVEFVTLIRPILKHFKNSRKSHN